MQKTCNLKFFILLQLQNCYNKCVNIIKVKLVHTNVSVYSVKGKKRFTREMYDTCGVCFT